MKTAYEDILRGFCSMPMSKHALNEDLVYQWFLTALADYELEIEPLGYSHKSRSFSRRLEPHVSRTLALMMYTNYLIPELSRVLKLNGIVGKDISITGGDTTKRVTMAELNNELERVRELLHKQKVHCFGNSGGANGRLVFDAVA